MNKQSGSTYQPTLLDVARLVGSTGRDGPYPNAIVLMHWLVKQQPGLGELWRAASEVRCQGVSLLNLVRLQHSVLDRWDSPEAYGTALWLLGQEPCTRRFLEHLEQMNRDVDVTIEDPGTAVDIVHHHDQIDLILGASSETSPEAAMKLLSPEPNHTALEMILNARISRGEGDPELLSAVRAALAAVALHSRLQLRRAGDSAESESADDSDGAIENDLDIPVTESAVEVGGKSSTYQPTLLDVARLLASASGAGPHPNAIVLIHWLVQQQPKFRQLWRTAREVCGQGVSLLNLVRLEHCVLDEWSSVEAYEAALWLLSQEPGSRKLLEQLEQMSRDAGVILGDAPGSAAYVIHHHDQIDLILGGGPGISPEAALKLLRPEPNYAKLDLILNARISRGKGDVERMSAVRAALSRRSA